MLERLSKVLRASGEGIIAEHASLGVHLSVTIEIEQFLSYYFLKLPTKDRQKRNEQIYFYWDYGLRNIYLLILETCTQVDNLI